MLDAEEGMMFICDGLLREMENTLGKERAKEIAYKAGYVLGEKLGKKLGGTLPEDALGRLTQNMPSCFEVKVVDMSKKEDSVEMAVQFTDCVIRRMLEYSRLPYSSVACKFITGYIEGALEAMTGMKAKRLAYESSISKMCIGTITISGVPQIRER